jgi:hypothetical protein
MKNRYIAHENWLTDHFRDSEGVHNSKKLAFTATKESIAMDIERIIDDANQHGKPINDRELIVTLTHAVHYLLTRSESLQ